MQEALRSAALNQRDNLFKTFMELGGRSQHDDLSDLPDYETEALATQCSAYIDRWSAPNPAYRQAAQGQVKKEVFLRLPLLLGIVKGLGADIEQGWLSSLEELVHADTFVDLLDQAGELQSKGLKDAAAVIAGSVLESHLKALSTKLAIGLSTPSGDPKKASVLNADLKKANAYNGAVEKQVTAWFGIREPCSPWRIRRVRPPASRRPHSGRHRLHRCSPSMIDPKWTIFAEVLAQNPTA